MSAASDQGVDFADFGRLVYPRLAGTLVLCGATPQGAAALVDRVVWSEVRSGLAGGTDATRLVVDEVLGRATPPPTSRPPRDDVERALAALPWSDRIAVVSRAALGPMAAAGRAAVPPPPVPGVDDAALRAAVDARAPVADPDYVRHLSRRHLRKWARPIAAVIAVVVLIGVVATIVAARAHNGRNRGPGTITEWVAVLDVGGSYADLSSGARAIAPVAGVNALIDRWGCYTGFPAGAPRPGGEWFLGVADTDRAVVDDIVTRLGRPVVTEALVRQGCPAPVDTTPTSIRS